MSTKIIYGPDELKTIINDNINRYYRMDTLTPTLEYLSQLYPNIDTNKERIYLYVKITF
jgi:hypothetical protein